MMEILKKTRFRCDRGLPHQKSPQTILEHELDPYSPVFSYSFIACSLMKLRIENGIDENLYIS